MSLMNLFKNGVGRPSNETLRKRKIACLIIGLVVIAIGIGVYLMFFYNNGGILATEKNASKRRKVTATFVSTGLDYIEKKKISCYISAGADSCRITLPIYNVEGSYNFFWSIKKLPKTNLTNYKWDVDYFYGIGNTYELMENTTFYPNTNNFHYDWSDKRDRNYSPVNRYRKFNIIESEKIGDTIFEFETGIPKAYIKDYIKEVKKIYKTLPWLFVPGKVFALTEGTYDSYSIAYGLTQHFFDVGAPSWNTSISIIDVKYDTIGLSNEGILPNTISLNATLHELAHAWDNYYRFNACTKSSCIEINGTKDLKELYNSTKKSKVLYKDANGEYISEVEFFAGMVTNYYWHVLKKDTTKPYYALMDNKKLNTSQKKQLKTLIEKYSKITSKY